MPLFANDYANDTTGKTFGIRYEPRMDAVQLHSELAYNVGEQFSATAGFTFNNYFGLKQEKRAWGLIPTELNAAIRWQLIRDLWFYSEAWVWKGARYLGKNGESLKGEDAVDLNAGAEFRITKNFNLWVQFNNLLNNKYERWHQYQSFGFNILGGITYSFSQK
jgi:outer membrane receptor protein involved in Fe transport